MRTLAGFMTAVLALFLSMGAVVSAGYHTQAEKLDKLRARISRVRDELRADHQRQDRFTQQLQGLDEDIGKAAAGVHELEQEIAAQHSRIAELRSRHERRSRQLAQQREYLARELVAAYALGRNERLRLLLEQEDPNRMDRVLVYYEYFNQARGRRIQESVQALESIRSLEQKLQVELAQLAQLKRQREAQRQSLERDRRQRLVLLEQLRRRMADRGRRLQQLQANEAELASLVQRLRQTLADIPADVASERPFQASKGKLSWPLQGSLIARYGAERDASVYWHGVFIAAKEGTPVHAVAAGRVVFADWLRGLGLLLIIDHGGGYMTLYGHNQSLYKEVGDWVEAGETIATVGVSGGENHAGLYFEVRVHGKPDNPLAWLRPGGQHG